VLVLFWTEYCVAGKKNLTMNALEEFHHVLQLFFNCVFFDSGLGKKKEI